MMLTANLGWAFFSIGQLTHYRSFEFSAVNPSAHLISPWVSLQPDGKREEEWSTQTGCKEQEEWG
jgi:hypothetical protein